VRIWSFGLRVKPALSYKIRMTQNPAIRLYGDHLWISPYVFSSFVALREKGLAFDVVPLKLNEGEQRRSPFRDQSLTGKVPTLEHEGFWLAESSVVVEYLDETFPAPRYPRLLPGQLRQRARARQVMAWLRSDLQALRDERPTTTMFYQRATTPLSAAGQAAADKLLHVADLLIAEGATSLFGPWCIADSELALMLHRLILNGHDVPPKIRHFAEVQWQRLSVREFVEHPRPPA
jgi:glutathione S-transferase